MVWHTTRREGVSPEDAARAAARIVDITLPLVGHIDEELRRSGIVLAPGAMYYRLEAHDRAFAEARWFEALTRPRATPTIAQEVMARGGGALAAYSAVWAAYDALVDVEAPATPLLARLPSLRDRPDEDVRDLVLEGLRVALRFARHGRPEPTEYWRQFRETLVLPGALPPLSLPTHPVQGAMRRALLNAKRTPERVRTRRGGSGDEVLDVRVHTDASAAPLRSPSGGEARPIGPGSQLLKTHLDLLDAALADGGDPPVFWYDVAAALERFGHVRQPHGAFDSRTMHEHTRRVSTLAATLVDVRPGGATAARPGHTLSTPYWFVERVERVTHSGVPARLLVRPGAWWDAHDLRESRAFVPGALLSLPIDGGGHEVNRLALRLAAELAVWNREEARRGVQNVRRPVGTLLERAGVATFDELEADSLARGNRAKRLRTYLAGDVGEGGALALLRRLDAFHVDVLDEADYWASGRGWLATFWKARLRLRVRAS